MQQKRAQPASTRREQAIDELVLILNINKRQNNIIYRSVTGRVVH